MSLDNGLALSPPSKCNKLSLHVFKGIYTDEGLTLETSVFESFTVANLPYRPCG